MLQQLVEFAQHAGIVSEPGFASKKVHWAVNVTNEGKFLAIDDLRTGKIGREYARCPDLSQGELIGGGPDNPRSHYLIESAETLLGYSKKTETDEKKVEKRAKKRQFFVDLLRQSADHHPDMFPLKSISLFLESESEVAGAREELARLKGSSTDAVGFHVEDYRPLEREDWHAWWRDFRRSLNRPADTDTTPRKPARAVGLVRDLLSGELVEALAVHPKIKGLAGVGGLGTGDALVSFDKAAFQSYGLEQSGNAPMSADSAACYVAALNHLIDRGQRLANNKICYWFSRPLDEDDLFSILLEASPSGGGDSSDVNQLIAAVRKGSGVGQIHDRFYLLTLSGSSGRVMVRDWCEGNFEELRESIAAWFMDLRIVRRDGSGDAGPPKFFSVLASLVRDSKDIPSPLAQGLFRQAITGGGIPLSVLTMALSRIRSELVSPDQPPFNHARMGLIKAYHNRKKGGNYVQPNLAKDHPEAAYQCGRLVAVLARLQEAAIPNVGAGVVQRFFSATCQAPGLMLGRLLVNAQHHLSASRVRGGLANYFEEMMTEILDRVSRKFPATLNIEKQSLFALGYYQQLAELNRDRSERAAQNKAVKSASNIEGGSNL